MQLRLILEAESVNTVYDIKKYVEKSYKLKHLMYWKNALKTLKKHIFLDIILHIKNWKWS